MILLVVGGCSSEAGDSTASESRFPEGPAAEAADPDDDPSDDAGDQVIPAPDSATTPPVSAATPSTESTESAESTQPTDPTEPGRVESVTLTPVVDGVAQITNIAHAGDDRLFLTLQPGEIVIVRDGQVLDDPFLDIRDQTDLRNATERGLLDVAFHPDYADNGAFFVNYTDRDGDTVVSRFTVSDDANRADPTSERIVLQVDQPFRNHNGGHIEFGPDGHLYVGMGDGGSADDPEGNGLNTTTLLGSILRLDVDTGPDVAYAIPADNPFVDDPDVLDEIWAYGVRNPWGLSFDPLTGELLFADVGQDEWEEVNVAPAGVGGQNYGWNAFEAEVCFTQSRCDAESATHTPPTFAYTHADGACSVTGGVVSRLAEQPELWGNYFFGDFCRGFVWAMAPNDDGTWDVRQVADESISTVAFGTDAKGNLYLADRLSDSLLLVRAG